eukprot:m.9244 g.9244  ORF g.9244 m.9244 type:complete len:54 (+) comp4030_c0_seq1:366-527(+)
MKKQRPQTAPTTKAPPVKGMFALYTVVTSGCQAVPLQNEPEATIHASRKLSLW